MTAEPSILSPLVSEDGYVFERQLATFRQRLDERLSSFLAAKQEAAIESAGGAAKLVDAIHDLALAGGKRLRPALVYHAYVACGGHDEGRAIPLALATELLHTYLLIHDDIMDHAQVRRGRPAAHVRFARQHRAAGFRGDSTDYGRTMAILAGDLAASYSSELFIAASAGTITQAALEATYSAMCQEVIHGQYLEIQVSYLANPSSRELERVLQLKSGRYSVERPIELGARLANADRAQLAIFSRYGAALGEAFQLQDDLLGLFGEAKTVGKPVGGDLAEGKFTFLIHHTLAGATAAEKQVLDEVRGHRDASPAALALAVSVIEASGARREVRRMISQRLEIARESLAKLALEGEGGAFLEGLIAYSEEREE